MNISKFTQKSMEAVNNCEKLAYEFGNQEIEQEHLLLALLEQDGGICTELLNRCGTEASASVTACSNSCSLIFIIAGLLQSCDGLFDFTQAVAQIGFDVHAGGLRLPHDAHNLIGIVVLKRARCVKRLFKPLVMCGFAHPRDHFCGARQGALRA